MDTRCLGIRYRAVVVRSGTQATDVGKGTWVGKHGQGSVAPRAQARPVVTLTGDDEVLAELAQLTRDLAFLGMCITDGNVSAAAQRHHADQLIVAGQRLRRRADDIAATVIEDETTVGDRSVALPDHTVEPPWSQQTRGEPTRQSHGRLAPSLAGGHRWQPESCGDRHPGVSRQELGE